MKKAVKWIFLTGIMLISVSVYAQQTVVENSNIAINQDGTIITDGQKRVLTHDNELVRRVNEENLLLKQVIRKIDAPLTGVEEVIRREKMRMLIERVNRNIQKIDEIRKDQEQQLKIQREQQQIMQQHEQYKKLPKM
ncbi:MAG: hypothetical protein KKH94_02250 [Candidatus Omnitrophica bacterium]|nr:hypothetical protein [Candidatus Omnitrophota bacterium]